MPRRRPPHPRPAPTVPTPEARLSPRQRETFRHLLTGAGEKQIARAMGVTPNTLHTHVTAVYRRLGVSSRPELMARYSAAPP